MWYEDKAKAVVAENMEATHILSEECSLQPRLQ